MNIHSVTKSQKSGKNYNSKGLLSESESQGLKASREASRKAAPILKGPFLFFLDSFLGEEEDRLGS
jgi:hypothetical protein